MLNKSTHISETLMANSVSGLKKIMLGNIVIDAAGVVHSAQRCSLHECAFKRSKKVHLLGEKGGIFFL